MDFKKRNFAVIFLYYLRVVYGQDFGYDESDGPNHWGDKYSKCLGKHQSPIDIEEDNIKIIQNPPLIFHNFNETLTNIEIKNNGHTAIMSIIEGTVPKISGGPLNGTYTFSQLHFHWGNDDTEGSENTIKHHRFPLELHMVFYKEDYKDFQEALNNEDGLTVLSFLYSVSKTPNKNYGQLLSGLGNIHEVGTSTKLKNFVPLEKFSLKNPQMYFTYEGSLTTPPCSEVVIWIEFVGTISLSSNQTEMFRLLHSNKHIQLRHNFRPVQPLHDRIIYLNILENRASIKKFNYFYILIVIYLFWAVS